jgi:hypothetical protein
LVLLREKDSDFYPQIPLDVVCSLRLTPRKYLLFLTWCIPGVEWLLNMTVMKLIPIETWMNGRYTTMFRLVTFLSMMLLLHAALSQQNKDLVHAVDLEVIKVRTNVPSQTRNDFRTNLVERDVRCVWTGLG